MSYYCLFSKNCFFKVFHLHPPGEKRILEDRKQKQIGLKPFISIKKQRRKAFAASSTKSARTPSQLYRVFRGLANWNILLPYFYITIPPPPRRPTQRILFRYQKRAFFGMFSKPKYWSGIGRSCLEKKILLSRLCLARPSRSKWIFSCKKIPQ